MSNIPQARRILTAARRKPTLQSTRRWITAALKLMDRRKAKFYAAREQKALSRRQAEDARMLRDKGWSLSKICKYLGTTNHGRVSEVTNPYPKKRKHAN